MTTTYKVEIKHRGNTYTIDVPEDQTILDVAHANNIDLPTSCGAGVCTTCAALITEGSVSREEGIGLSPELQDEGYALLCVAYPRSDVKLESDKEEMVYDRQFGKSA
ncbi:ferredoxin [Picosynechococcus sp. PCC 7003]|uniref:2Fe-2S iron-sulfur cluster-binding protein n=1 Tax=Picosynechococcus sp. PCC 7003 TaxID=374981 RepID=UPI000810E67D|nr:2Fe-2S iron-sulfur cluster-binding protein [Picosynechococcus sp. PCC 7003]ANV84877.1 ferredoxin [Picosynechococcus sp. PCC 7003]